MQVFCPAINTFLQISLFVLSIVFRTCLIFFDEYLPFTLKCLAVESDHAYGCAAFCYLENFLEEVILYSLYFVLLGESYPAVTI